jgi:hypothetical protein
MVKLDGQPWPEWAEYVAVNGKDFVRVVWRDFDRDLPEIRQITSRFTHASRWNKPGQKPRVGGSPRSPRRSA